MNDAGIVVGLFVMAMGGAILLHDAVEYLRPLFDALF